MEKKYINPVAGVQGVEFGDRPAQITRKQLIHMGCESVIGTSNSIESEFDSFLRWLETAGDQKVDFRYDDLTMDELVLLDSIVFSCSVCGWNYSEDEHHVHEDESMCDDCFVSAQEDDD